MTAFKTRGKTTAGAAAMLALTITIFAGSVAATPAAREAGWRLFASDGFPLKFEYPAGLFPSVSDDVAAGGAGQGRRTGRVFTSADGDAQLQVGAFDNVDKLSARELRARALTTSYDGASVEYDRLTPSWFVLSGRRDETMFYERITLTCDGKRIDVWTMSYPVAQRAFYDRIVEEMARRYRQALRDVRCQ